MTLSASLSVPGNLLLLGEYAVLEEGGLGLALAVEPRVRLAAQPARPAAGQGGLRIEGAWGERVVRWSPERPGESPLFRAVVEACRERLAALGVSALPAGRIVVDSSALVSWAGGSPKGGSPKGGGRAGGARKSGLGSSAAAAVGLSFALFRLAGILAEALAEEALAAALEGHRRAQGGRGSGYDVYASAHGGLGLFTGGRRPRWEPRRLEWLPPLCLFRGPRCVSTASAVGRYEAWKRRDPAGAGRFLRRSNENLLAFLRSRSWEEARRHLQLGRELGIGLGEAIGVDARLEPPAGSAAGLVKALGAGNELGLFVPETGAGAGDGPFARLGFGVGRGPAARSPAGGPGPAGRAALLPLVPAGCGVIWEP